MLKSFNKNNFFTKQFKKAIIDCFSNPIQPDSVVLETITGRGSVYSVIRRLELIRRADGLIFEHNLNMNLYQNQIMPTVIKNKNQKFRSFRTKYETTTPCMANEALSLLLAEHYLEENDEFYSLVHSINFISQVINNHLDEWTKGYTEKYFIENSIYMTNMFSLFQKKLKQIKDKLESAI